GMVVGRPRPCGARHGGPARHQLPLCHGHGSAHRAGGGTRGRAARHGCRALPGAAGGHHARRPAEPVWLARLAPAHDAAGPGGLGRALAGRAHHAAVVAGGGRPRLASVPPLYGSAASWRSPGWRSRGGPMTILYLLLPLSLVFVLAIGAALGWAIFNGQF